MVMGNTNFQTIYPMGGIVNGMVKQATGREPVDNLDMDYVTVAQNTVVGELEFTGDVVQFQTGRSVPIRKLEVSLEPVQSGTGDPSPENVRPISGWDKASFTICGKNLFNNDTSKIKTVPHGTDGGGLENRYGYEFYLPEGTYQIRAQRASGSGNRYLYGGVYKKNTRELVSQQNIWAGNSGNLRTLVVASDEFVIYYYASSVPSISEVRTYFSQFNIMMVKGDMVDFEPYTGETITTEFPTPPGTVYGGTLDVVSGKLTVTWTGVDMSSLPWQAVSTYFRTSTTPAKKPGIVNVLCSYYRTSSAGSATVMADQSVKGNSDNNYIYAKDGSFASVEEFKTAVAGQKLVYELATPQTCQLTPQEVNTLVGDNTIYSDAGAVDVMYWVYREMS